MKILIRRFDNEYYVWKDATYVNGTYYITHPENGDDICVNETCILAVKDDNRKGKVMCLNCGELIEDTPEAIEKHFADREASKNCLTCNKCVPYGDKKNLVKTYVANGDGTYHESINSDVKLCCSMVYYNKPDISNPDAEKICQFNQCRKGGVSAINDFFIKYPNAFNKQITVDFLMKRGFAYAGYYGGYFYYDLQLRGALHACVNEMGIVDHFDIKHRDCHNTAYYSNEYKKLFFDSRCCYSESIPSSMSATKHKNAKDKIAALYEEASK